MDQKGKEFIQDEEYDFIHKVPYHPYYKVGKKGKHGLLNSDGLAVFPVQYNNLKILGNKEIFLWIEDENGQWSYYDFPSKQKAEFMVKEFSKCEPSNILQGEDWYLLMMDKECVADEQNTYLWKDGQLKALGDFWYFGKLSGDVVFLSKKEKKYILTKDFKLVDVSQYDRVSDFEY